MHSALIRVKWIENKSPSEELFFKEEVWGGGGWNSFLWGPPLRVCLHFPPPTRDFFLCSFFRKQKVGTVWRESEGGGGCVPWGPCLFPLAMTSLTAPLSLCVGVPGTAAVWGALVGKARRVNPSRNSSSSKRSGVPRKFPFPCFLQGMGYLHARGILHKDLKSKNVFYDNGKVVITDFGLFSISGVLQAGR